MPEKDREAKGDRMLWEDTTLSRHSEIERNCEIGPATAFGGEVGGPWRSNVADMGCGVQSPKRLQATDRSVAPPVPSVTTQVIPENFCGRTGAMTWTGLNVDTLRPAQDCVKILTTE